MYCIGLTGGIGSGKSQVADLLQAWGAAVIDTDQIARALTAAHGAALPLLHAAFGADIFSAEGELDRAALRERVFADAAQRLRLEAILHPMIEEETQRQTQHHTQRIGAQKRGTYLVYVVPLLVESGRWRDRVARICVVDCEPSTQIARVQARSQRSRNPLSAAAIQRIMAAQASRAARLALADDVILNDAATTLAQLHARARSLHNRWCTLSRNLRCNPA